MVAVEYLRLKGQKIAKVDRTTMQYYLYSTDCLFEDTSKVLMK